MKASCKISGYILNENTIKSEFHTNRIIPNEKIFDLDKLKQIKNPVTHII